MVGLGGMKLIDWLPDNLELRGLSQSGVSPPLPELHADHLPAPPDDFTASMLVVSFLERQFETVRHLRRHRQYDLGPVGRDVHHLTFNRIAARHDDPRRHLADAPDSSFDLS